MLDLERISAAFEKGKELYLALMSAQGEHQNRAKQWDDRVMALERELYDVRKQREDAVASYLKKVNEATLELVNHQADTEAKLGVKIDFGPGSGSGGTTRL